MDSALTSFIMSKLSDSQREEVSVKISKLQTAISAAGSMRDQLVIIRDHLTETIDLLDKENAEQN
jgi:hypothetical protein